MADRVTKLISTFFGLGYFPLAPGTMGSLAGLLIYVLIANFPFLYFALTLFILILGFLVCSKAEELFNRKDPAQVVIDEVAGMLIALLFLPKTLPVVFSVFFLFRGFDVIKPAPANKWQNFSGAKGIMLDDIVAGIYTNLLIQLTLFLVNKIS